MRRLGAGVAVVVGVVAVVGIAAVAVVGKLMFFYLIILLLFCRGMDVSSDSTEGGASG